MKHLSIFLLCFLITKSVFPQVQLIKDINQTVDYSSNGINASEIVELNNIAYFSANDTLLNYELWATDGTPQGTYLAVDINPGGSGSYPKNITNCNGMLYFSARSSQYGRELYRSDGTASGTIRISDINLDDKDSNPDKFTFHQGSVYFTAYDQTYKYQLWKTDGTSNGTVRITSLPQTSSYYSDFIKELTSCGNYLFFTSGGKLYRTDGTSSGTQMISVGSNTSSSYSLFDFNNTLYFVNNNFLFRATGSSNIATGGISTKTIPVMAEYKCFAELNNELYFLAINSWYDNNYKLYKFNGASVSMVKSGLDKIEFPIFSSANNIYWLAEDTYGNSLMKSDGTNAGTIKAGSSSIDDMNLYHATNNKLYYGYTSNYHGKLKVFDETNSTDSFISVSGGVSNPDRKTAYIDSNFVFINNGILYKVNDSITQSGRILQNQTFTESGFDTYDPDFVVLNNKVLFQANSGTPFKEELWITDGTSSGTQMVKDINTQIGSKPCLLTKVGNDVYFYARSGNHDHSYKLHKTLGTSSTTVSMGLPSTEPLFMVEFNGILVIGFNGSGAYLKTYNTNTGVFDYMGLGGNFLSGQSIDVIHGNTFYITTSAKVYKCNTNLSSSITLSNSFAITIKPYNNGVIFTQQLSNTKEVVVYSDPTLSNTTSYIIPNIVLSQDVALLGNELLYVGDDGGTSTMGAELWKINLLTGSHSLVKDIQPGYQSSIWGTKFCLFNNHLYFKGYDQNGYGCIFKSDGTSTGTQVFLNSNSSNNIFGFNDIFEFNGELFFTLRNGFYKSDGTIQGIKLLSNNSGMMGGYFFPDMNNKNFNFFGSKGLFLYSTSKDTILKLCDVIQQSGTNFGVPKSMGSYFLFVYESNKYGKELCRIDIENKIDIQIQDTNVCDILTVHLSTLIENPITYYFMVSTDSSFTIADTIQSLVLNGDSVIHMNVSHLTHQVAYYLKVSDGNAEKLASRSFILRDVYPNVTFSFNNGAPICDGDSLYNLNGGLPVGGDYLGYAVSNNQLDLSLLSPGDHEVSYYYTDVNYCPTLVKDTFKVLPIPSLDLGSDTTICNDQSLLLNTGSNLHTTWNDGSILNIVTVDSTGIGVGAKSIWCQVMDNNGCIAMDSIVITFQNCTGIEDLDYNDLIEVYPNPTSGMVNISFKTSFKELTVEILSIDGKLLQSNKHHHNCSNSSIVDLSFYDKGIYFIRFSIDEKVNVVKLIKH